MTWEGIGELECTGAVTTPWSFCPTASWHTGRPVVPDDMAVDSIHDQKAMT